VVVVVFEKTVTVGGPDGGMLVWLV